MLQALIQKANYGQDVESIVLCESFLKNISAYRL